MKWMNQGLVWASGLLLVASCQSQPAAETEQQVKIFSVEELTEMLIEIDALDDRTLAGEYAQTLTSIEESCSERTQAIVLAAMRLVEAENSVGVQYAILNYLEDVEFAAEAYQTPIECLELL
ncbi:MAG: hypothetical protein AAF609_12580 [Cyanobacteria bacterium P01_C01_bin.120]